MKILPVLIAAFVAGCALQRAEVAKNAQAQLVGMSREQVLACMGAPAQRATEGATEVWAYPSGGATVTSGVSNASISGNNIFGFGTGVSRALYCNVSIIMMDGRVSRVNYAGPTGGLITAGEQCAYAVQNCLPPK